MTTYLNFISSNYETIKTITLLLLPFFFLIDNLIIYFTLKRKHYLNYWYIDSYKKYGFKQITIVKVIFLIIQIYLLHYPIIRVSDPVLLLWLYYLIVTISIYKFLLQKIKGQVRS